MRLDYLIQQPCSCSGCRTIRKLQQRHYKRLDYLGHSFSLVSNPLSLKTNELLKVTYIYELTQSVDCALYTSQPKVIIFVLCLSRKICVTCLEGFISLFLYIWGQNFHGGLFCSNPICINLGWIHSFSLPMETKE